MKGWTNGGRGALSRSRIATLPPGPMPGIPMGPDPIPTAIDHALRWLKAFRVAFWVWVARLLVQPFNYNVYQRGEVLMLGTAGRTLSRLSRHGIHRQRAGLPISKKLRAVAKMTARTSEIIEASPMRRLP